MGTDTGSPAAAAPSTAIPTIQPPPAYVATAAASQLVTDAHLFALQHAEEPPPPSTSHESAVLSPGALSQVNAFLDHLLYRFLATSGSPRFRSLKSGVENALRGKLGKLAMASAQAELEDLLAEGEDEELAIEESELQSESAWDTEIYFRRTRLRVMVYMRLGEMEDEDEEDYLEGLGDNGQRLGDQPDSEGLVSWAGAIFLTSILEFVAEECLKVAGQSAYKKAMTKRAAQSPQTVSSGDGRIYVTEADLDKAGLDARLGRHWRSWKHKMRVPFHERNNSSGLRSGLTSRKTSISTMRSEYIQSPHVESGPPLPTTINEPQEFGEVRDSPVVDDRPASAGHQEQPPQEDAKVIQAMRASKQRPASLNISSRSKDFDSSDMTPEQERALLRRLRAQTLPSPGATTALESELSPSKKNRHSNKISVFPEGHVDEMEEQTIDARDDEIEAPPRSPLPNPLSAHPIGENSHDDYHEGSWLAAGSQRSSAGRTRPVDSLRPSPTDTARSDNSPVFSGKRDTKGSQYSARTSSKTSLEEGVDQLRLSKVRTSSDQQLPRGLHSSKAMRQDSFPKLDTSYQTAESSPSTSAVSPHPSRTSSKKDYQQQQARTSSDDPSFTWFRKASNASKRSRSSSKATQNDLHRPSKETLETTTSNGSRNSKGETIQERPFSELIADREMIKLKLTPKQLQKIEVRRNNSQVTGQCSPQHRNPRSRRTMKTGLQRRHKKRRRLLFH